VNNIPNFFFLIAISGRQGTNPRPAKDLLAYLLWSYPRPFRPSGLRSMERSRIPPFVVLEPIPQKGEVFAGLRHVHNTPHAVGFASILDFSCH